MREQYYYANFPTKLLHEEFKDAEDLKNHLSAMALIVSYVHTETGEFYLSRGVLARKLGISERKARRIIDNFINWGYIEKIEDKKGKKNIAIYKLKTYNFDLQERPTECPTKRPTECPTKIQKYQYSDLQERPTECPTKRPTECPQTNNELTNNEKTNNEINNKENLSQTNSNIEKKLEQAADKIMSEDICLTTENLEREFQLIRGMYEKKTGNYKNQRDKYFTLRLKHHVPFETIKDAIENYIAEMHTEEIDLKYWKNLENLLTIEELRPFMYVPVKAQTREGLWIEGEFCQLLNVIKYKLPDGTTGRKVLSKEELTRLFEENRIEFLDFYEDYVPISVYKEEALTDA